MPLGEGDALPEGNRPSDERCDVDVTAEGLGVSGEGEADAKVEDGIV